MRAVVKKLSEDEIAKLPFPDTARAIGGILVLEPETELMEHLMNVEEFRRLWKQHMEESKTAIWHTPIFVKVD